MMPAKTTTMSKQGARACLIKLGLESESSDIDPRLVAAGLAAPTPFLGMIGQKPIIHDPATNPNIPRFESARDIEHLVRPGDVLITGKDEPSIWRGFSEPFSGSALYHAETVGRNRTGHPTHVGNEMFNSPRWTNASDDELARNALRIRNMARGHYPDFVVLRPKNLGGNTEPVMQDVLARSKRKYDLDTALGAWLHDIFVPKTKLTQKIRPEVICEGNICSTIPSMALKSKANIDVIPGTPASLTMPADFLRSTEFEPIAAVGTHTAPGTFTKNVKPFLARGALGLGVAGAAYEASEHPDITAGLAGYGLTNHLIRKYTGPINAENLQDLGHLDAPHTLLAGDKYVPGGRRALAQFATRRVAPSLLAGVGSYALAKHLFNSRKNQDVR